MVCRTANNARKIQPSAQFHRPRETKRTKPAKRRAKSRLLDPQTKRQPGPRCFSAGTGWASAPEVVVMAFHYPPPAARPQSSPW